MDVKSSPPQKRKQKNLFFCRRHHNRPSPSSSKRRQSPPPPFFKNVHRPLLSPQKEECPRRLMKCQHCELEVIAQEFQSHVDYCESRTELCKGCTKYVQFKHLQFHYEYDHKYLTPDEKGEYKDWFISLVYILVYIGLYTGLYWFIFIIRTGYHCFFNDVSKWEMMCLSTKMPCCLLMLL